MDHQDGAVKKMNEKCRRVVRCNNFLRIAQKKTADHLIALTRETCREPIHKPPELKTVSATITLRCRNWSAI